MIDCFVFCILIVSAIVIFGIPAIDAINITKFKKELQEGAVLEKIFHHKWCKTTAIYGVIVDIVDDEIALQVDNKLIHYTVYELYHNGWRIKNG